MLGDVEGCGWTVVGAGVGVAVVGAGVGVGVGVGVGATTICAIAEASDPFQLLEVNVAPDTPVIFALCAAKARLTKVPTA